MVKKKFYINLIIRIIGIIGLSIILAINLFQYEKLFTVLASGIGLFILGYDLLRYTNKMNRELLSFFEALKYEDHSFGMKKMSIPGFMKLSEYMNELNEQLSNIKIESEIQAQYLDSIIEHIQVGLLAVHPSGNTEFVNSAAQKILQIHRINHISVIREKYPEFGTILKNIKPGGQKLVKLYTNEGTKQLSLRASSFRSRHGTVNLYSFQNVEMELEETEIETWKKLIRVLTHEINNSITPIHSLSDTLKTQIKANNNKNNPAGENKILEGLDIIQQRTKGLLDFVEKFRSLTPKGNLQKEQFQVSELFYRLKILMPEYCKPKNNFNIQTNVMPEKLELFADQKYIEQVLINLVKNAIDALENDEDGIIQMKAFHSNGNTLIQVADNGKGISKEEAERIFIPFYTTKQSGSGIGLSLSRQLMKMHGGSISVQSEPNKGTKFTLKFPVN